MNQAAPPPPSAENLAQQGTYPNVGVNVSAAPITAQWATARMADQGLQHELDLRDQLAEEKTDRKFDQVLHRIDALADELSGKIASVKSDADVKFAAMQTRLEMLPGKWLMGSTVIASVAVVGALIYAGLQYGGGQFSNGMSARVVADESAKRASDVAVERVLAELRAAKVLPKQ